MSKITQKQAKRRTEIIKTAMPIISGVGFDDISVQEICTQIGISVGTFYHYFTKKSDLLVCLLWLIDEDMENNVFPLLTSEDEIQNLCLFAHSWASYVHAHGLAHSKLISGINPESHDFAEGERPSVILLHDIIVRGQEKGQIIRDHSPAQLADSFLLTLRGITLDWSRRDGCYDIVEKMDRHMQLFLRAFKA